MCVSADAVASEHRDVPRLLTSAGLSQLSLLHSCPHVAKHTDIVFDVPAGDNISSNLLQVEICLHNLSISEQLLGKMEDMPGIFLAA